MWERNPPLYCTLITLMNRHAGARRLRSFVQIVRTRLPSQAMDLAVRVGGKESDV